MGKLLYLALVDKPNSREISLKGGGDLAEGFFDVQSDPRFHFLELPSKNIDRLMKFLHLALHLLQGFPLFFFLSSLQNLVVLRVQGLTFAALDLNRQLLRPQGLNFEARLGVSNQRDIPIEEIKEVSLKRVLLAIKGVVI
jgi:hypothetical protein